jgi:hypothetical protein
MEQISKEVSMSYWMGYAIAIAAISFMLIARMEFGLDWFIAIAIGTFISLVGRYGERQMEN